MAKVQPAGPTASILLVDDNPANLLALQAILEGLHFNLVEAQSGEEALERMASEEFAVVLLDVLMPGMSGFETARRIRHEPRTRHTPIVFLTAKDLGKAHVEEAYALGAVDFLVKPVLPIALQMKVRGFADLFLEKQRARMEAEQLGLLIHGTADYAIFMLDPEGRVMTWNPGAQRLKGYQPEEIIGSHFSRFYPEEAKERHWPQYEIEVAKEEGRFEDEGWRVRKDGSQFWANVIITALRDKSGVLRGFSKITRDLTARKQAEEALRRSEERFRQLIEGVKDYAIFLLDPSGHVASWNTGAERIKGYQADEIIGQHFSRFYPQEAIDRGWPDHELKVARLEGRFEDEGWRLRKDGSPFWANVVITALFDEKGVLRGYSKITRDLTERRQAEEHARRLAEETAARRTAEQNAAVIQEERERLRVTLNSIGDAVISTDAQGHVTFINPVAERLVGWKSEDAARLTLEEVFRIVNETTRQSVENPAVRALREGVIVGLANHTILISRDGREWPIDDSAAPIRDIQDNVIGSVLVFRDITERKVAEQRLREQQEWLQVTLSSIGDAVVATDTAGQVTLLNAVAEQLTGWSQSEAQGQPLETVFVILNEQTGMPVEHPVARVLREGKTVGLGNHTILVARDGARRPIDDSAAPIRDASGRLIGVVLIFRDVTQQRRAERHRNARLAVTQALSESATFLDGARAVLRGVCESLFWDVGFFWTIRGDALVCRQSWRRSGVPETAFENETCGGTFARGVGLPGRVWASGQPAWILHIAEDDNFPRMAAALAHGLHSAFACPVIVGDHTLGVIEFFTTSIRDADPDLLEMMGTITGSLGQFMERKTAEEELRQSERELADFFENATVGLHWVGPDSTILRANQAELDLLGYTRDEYIGRPVADFHADQRSACDLLERLLSGQNVAEYPARLRCKDDSIKEVLIDSSAFFRDGQFVHTRCFTRDITDRRQAELALRESEQRFREVADAMPQIVWTARPDGNIDYLNHRWEEYTGLPTTVGNEAWEQILHPADAPRAHERWAQSLASGAPFEMQLRLLDRRRQSYRWHLMRTIAVHDDGGKVVHWYGTSTDIHEQKHAEESSRFLAEASAALASIVDYESTLQKVVNLAVPYFADWAAVDIAEKDGFRRLAVAHQDPAKIEFVHELMRAYPPALDAQAGVAAVLRTGKPEIISEITDDLLVKEARDQRHLELIRSLGLRSYICVPLVVSGATLGALSFVTAESGRRYSEMDLLLAIDLANRAAVAIENTQLYQALRENDRRKDEFLATLAHELRNPLAPIRNSLQILKLPRVDAETIERSRDMMERQVQHLVRLVDDLLDVSRVMRGKIELRKERIELAEVIARAVETTQPLFDAQQHQLSVQLSNESLPLDADPVRLTQVISNLLTNAAKYTEPNGHVWLTAHRQAGMAEVRIRDSGIGIAPDMLPHIFELFVQADHAAARSQGGLGVGLTLVKNLVEMHNGSVEARSGGLGRGSEFVVRLPLTRVAAETLDEPGIDVGTTTTTGYRLLVVDDNQDAADSLGMLLRLQGHEVRVAYSGKAALEMVKQYAPHLVFLDLGMPGMDGYEVARRLRQEQRFANLKLAALTGWGQQEDRRRTAEAGFTHHLVKPPEPKLIEGLLAELKLSRNH